MNNLFLPNQYVYNLRKLDNGCVLILNEDKNYENWDAAKKMKESILNKIKESDGDFTLDIKHLKKEW